VELLLDDKNMETLEDWAQWMREQTERQISEMFDLREMLQTRQDAIKAGDPYYLALDKAGVKPEFQTQIANLLKESPLRNAKSTTNILDEIPEEWRKYLGPTLNTLIKEHHQKIIDNAMKLWLKSQ